MNYSSFLDDIVVFFNKVLDTGAHLQALRVLVILRPAYLFIIFAPVGVRLLGVAEVLIAFALDDVIGSLHRGSLFKRS